MTIIFVNIDCILQNIENNIGNCEKYCKLKDEIEWERGATKGKARRESVSHSQLEF